MLGKACAAPKHVRRCGASRSRTPLHANDATGDGPQLTLRIGCAYHCRLVGVKTTVLPPFERLIRGPRSGWTTLWPDRCICS